MLQNPIGTRCLMRSPSQAGVAPAIVSRARPRHDDHGSPHAARRPRSVTASRQPHVSCSLDSICHSAGRPAPPCGPHRASRRMAREHASSARLAHTAAEAAASSPARATGPPIGWSPATSPVPAATYQKRWVMLVQLEAVGAGLVLGIFIRPEAVTTLLFSAVLQLVATVIGWRGIGGPVAYAGAVALVVLGAAADPALRELLYVGGFPYAHLGLALATQAPVSRARTVTGLIGGVVP